MPTTLRAVAKAKKKPDNVAVYDSNGNLVGVVDRSAIAPISDAATPEPISTGKDPGRPVHPGDQVAGPGAVVSETSDDVTKALSRLPRGERASITKAALPFTRQPISERYELLLKSLPSSVAASIESQVAVRATQLAVVHRIAGPQAVDITKRAVLDGARRAGVSS